MKTFDVLTDTNISLTIEADDWNWAEQTENTHAVFFYRGSDRYAMVNSVAYVIESDRDGE